MVEDAALQLLILDLQLVDFGVGRVESGLSTQGLIIERKVRLEHPHHNSHVLGQVLLVKLLVFSQNGLPRRARGGEGGHLD